MSRNHRKAGIISFICTDTYHHDTREFREQGHHLVGALRMGLRPDGKGTSLVWHGAGPRSREAVLRTEDSKVTLSSPGIVPRLPIKESRRPDGLWVYKFSCPCGRDPQRLESYLAELVTRYRAANPLATRIDIDITSI